MNFGNGKNGNFLKTVGLLLKHCVALKNAPGCTGMFWRANPVNGKKGSNDNWPRDGAQLKGIVHEVKGARWLECSW